MIFRMYTVEKSSVRVNITAYLRDMSSSAAKGPPELQNHVVDPGYSLQKEAGMRPMSLEEIEVCGGEDQRRPAKVQKPSVVTRESASNVCGAQEMQ